MYVVVISHTHTLSLSQSSVRAVNSSRPHPPWLIRGKVQISDFGLARWLPSEWTHHAIAPIEGTFG
jgi:hypothetical protein